jgi:tetratricopeptide (TPR) repeat protein
MFDEAYLALAKANPDTLDDTDLKRASLNAEAQLAVRQGLFKRAIEAGERLMALGDTDDADTLLTLALARAMSGDWSKALELMNHVDELHEPRDAIEAVNRQKHRVLIHMNSRNYELAARAATELAALARAAGLRFDTAATQHNLGDIYDRLGDHPRAYAAFVESLELARQLEQDRLTNLNQMHLCLLDGLRSAEGAADRLKALIRHADAKGYLWDVLEGRLLLARLAANVGDHGLASELLTEVTEMAKQHGHRLIELDAQELLESIKGDSLHG